MIKRPKTFIPLKTHSTSDWDFSDNNWELSATHFVSPPTALHVPEHICQRILCRIAESLVLPQGRFVTQIYLISPVVAQIVFRHQNILGDASLEDCYIIRFQNNEDISLQNRLGEVEGAIGTWDIQPTLDQWQKYRITWWNGVDERNIPALAVMLELEAAGVWTSYGTLYDPLNRWKDSAMNRCGFGQLWPVSYYDDTEIWMPQ